ncbi:MAG: sulfotransferase domain-containing protein [Pseudomonadota bacterium]
MGIGIWKRLRHGGKVAELGTPRNSPLTDADSFGIFSMGKYYDHLSAYYDYYGRDRILVLNFEEEIAAHPEISLKRVCDFLDIDSSYVFKDKEKRQNAFDFIRTGTALAHHWLPKQPLIHRAVAKLPAKLLGERVAKRRPSDHIIQALYRFYQADNQKLFKLLNRRFESWEKMEAASERLVPYTAVR